MLNKSMFFGTVPQSPLVTYNGTFSHTSKYDKNVTLTIERKGKVIYTIVYGDQNREVALAVGDIIRQSSDFEVSMVNVEGIELKSVGRYSYEVISVSEGFVYEIYF